MARINGRIICYNTGFNGWNVFDFHTNAQSHHYRNVMKLFEVNNIADPLIKGSSHWREWVIVRCQG
jgi:hypothetical protein